ncbi:hypothetical protein [Bradyrhizobium sp. Rc3b]|uniref:hypothetical protein n=1 Tax=Bradyrhizobium sp. Rc3b TaxID=1855322 RepID=UPI0015A599D8|nr:hypothetical protein [Bradyrhizobium sp. Rc3b]
MQELGIGRNGDGLRLHCGIYRDPLEVLAAQRAGLVRRVKRPKWMLADKAYSAELREELDERATKPVIPNPSNRNQPYCFSKRSSLLRAPLCLAEANIWAM